MKFGGTSIADADRIRRATDIVAERVDRDPVVVVSALGGVTDLLVVAIDAARRGRREELDPVLADLERRHRWAVEGCLHEAGPRHDLNLALDATFDELRQLLRSVRFLGEVTPRARDTLLAFGELLSSRIVCAALEAGGVSAVWVDPRSVMYTDATFGAALPHASRVAASCEDHVVPIVRDGSVPVTGGFVGSSPAGDTTTLGRGGSDTSAAVLGAALGAVEIQIWSDVDGMMTADPRIVPDARTLPRISFAEATELSLYGAKVLHPASVESAIRQNIPVRILNASRPAGRGTEVTCDPDPGRRGIAAVACRGGIATVRVVPRGRRMTAAALTTVLEACENAGAAIELMVASETGVTVAVGGDGAAEFIGGAITGVGEVEIVTERAVVCIVGHDLGANPETRGAALEALAAARSEVATSGASPHSLTAIVPEADLGAIANAMHAQCSEDRS